jgi:hypothetical protein
MSDKERPNARSPKPRSSGTGKMLLALLTIAVLVGGVGAYLYFRVLRPPQTASRHLPRGTAVAARVDALELLTFRPVRERLLPLVEEAKSADAKGSTLLERVGKESGVRLPMDVRELAVGSVDGRQWVLAVGGTMRAGDFVDALEKALNEDGIAGFNRDGDLLIHTATGGAIGQADDGTLVFGTGKGITLAALPPRDETDEADAVPLPTKGAITFLLNGAATRGAGDALPKILDSLGSLSHIDRVDGALSLGDAPAVDVRIRPRGTTPAELAKTLETDLAAVKLALFLVPDDLGDAKAALGAAKVRADGGEVRVEAPWPYDALDRGVARLADLVRLSLALPPATK